MNTLAGIDLGTTYSALAVLNELGKAEIVPDLNSNRITPSVVYFSNSDSASVGVDAKNKLNEDPDNVIQFVKRQMGNPSYRYKAYGKEYSPMEISALILKKLKEECTQLGEIKDVVITVPAHFNEVERKSTMDAGSLAGLNVLGIINEPTAAAMYYSSLSPISGNIVVYDLGGGTFDVTIINMSGRKVEVLTSKGDGNLGGVDFDNEIVKFINNKANEIFGKPLFCDEILENPYGAYPQEEKRLYAIAMREAEKQKKTLSARESAKIRLTTPLGNLSVDLTRSDFEEMISCYVATTEMLVENALEDAHLETSDISKVLLVGGSTRIPMISSSIEKMFGFLPEKAVNVDEAVALGAAISAGMKKISIGGIGGVSAAIKTELSKTNLKEVCNKNFGTLAVSYIESLGRNDLENSVILRKNTQIPCECTKEFYTMYDNQQAIEVRVTECEEETRDKDGVSIIGKFELKLPKNTQKGSKVQITYAYDANQRLECTVKLPDGQSYQSTICYDDEGNLVQEEMRRKQASLNDFIIE